MSQIDGKLLQGDDFFTEVPTGLINSSNVTYSLTEVPSDSLRVNIFLNGLMKIPTTDYSISGQTITMVVAPATGQTILAKYLKRN